MTITARSGSVTSRRTPGPDEQPARRNYRLHVPTAVIAGTAAWLSWRGWEALGHSCAARSIGAGRAELAGPVVIGCVLVVFCVEQLYPAQRRPLLARGHLLDVAYLLFYALLVVPLIVLMGSGFAGVLTAYACLGALPHANVRWTYGRAGRIFISPAYHRIQHAATGRLDINLGTVFPFWDMLSRRAVFPRPAEGCHCHRPGRPADPGRAVRRPPSLARTMLIQLAEPFTSTSSESS